MVKVRFHREKLHREKILALLEMSDQRFVLRNLIDQGKFGERFGLILKISQIALIASEFTLGYA